MARKKINSDDDRKFTKTDISKKKTRPKKKKSIKKKPVLSKASASSQKTQKKASPKKAYNDIKVKKELKQIYENSDGSMPNMRNFGPKKSGRFLSAMFIFLLACGFLGFVAWFGFFVFQPMSKFVEDDVNLLISGPEHVMIGEEVTYKIEYNNSQVVDLAQANLQLRYPDGFVFESSVPESTGENSTWNLGTIKSKNKGVIEIKGRIYADIGSQQSIRAFLNYMPGNFSSEFQKVNTFTINIDEIPVNMEVSVSDEIIPASETEFIVNVEKKSDAELSNLQNLAIVFEPEYGWQKIDSDPESVEDNQYMWYITDLSEKDWSLRLKGVFNPGDLENGNLVFKLVGWKDENRKDIPYEYQIFEKDVLFLQTDLSLGFSVNGALSDIKVNPNDVLNSSIVIKNTGENPIKNISVNLIFETPSFDNRSMLNWYELTDVLDGEIVGEQVNEQTRRGIITWDSRHVAKLATLGSGEEYVIDFSIPFKNSKDIDLTKFTTYLAKSFVEVNYLSGDEKKLLSSNEINMTVNSDLELEIRDSISENSAGKEVHNITWFLSNTYHELKDISLNADFYGDIDWQEEGAESSDGDFVFDKEKKSLVWNIGTMPIEKDVNALQFSILLNSKDPSQKNLSSKVKLKATDAVTGENIIISGREILLLE